MPDFIFDLFFRYAWFVVGIFSTVNLIRLPQQADKIAAQSGENSENVRAFLVSAGIYFTVPYFVLGILQLLGGFEYWYYFFFTPLDDPFMLAALLFTISWWALGAYFVYFRGGAEALYQYQIMRVAGSVRSVKIVVACLIIFGLATLICVRFVLPPPTF